MTSQRPEWNDQGATFFLATLTDKYGNVDGSWLSVSPVKHAVGYTSSSSDRPLCFQHDALGVHRVVGPKFQTEVPIFFRMPLNTMYHKRIEVASVAPLV